MVYITCTLQFKLPQVIDVKLYGRWVFCSSSPLYLFIELPLCPVPNAGILIRVHTKLGNYFLQFQILINYPPVTIPPLERIDSDLQNPTHCRRSILHRNWLRLRRGEIFVWYTSLPWHDCFDLLSGEICVCGYTWCLWWQSKVLNLTCCCLS